MNALRMIKVKAYFQPDIDIDMILENDTCLFRTAWNGEVYLTGTRWNEDLGRYVDDGCRYRPVWEEVDGMNYFKLVGAINEGG